MALEIIPDQVTLTGKESVQFVVKKDGTPIEVKDWEFQGPGTLKEGKYTAPRFIPTGKRFIVTALAGTERVSAKVKISSTDFWIALLWSYLALVVLGCSWAIYCLWPPSKPVLLVVGGPALVTLKQGDAQLFTSNEKAAWAGLTDGRYEAKGGAGAARVFSSDSGPGMTVAVVETQEVSLKITPSYAVVKPGQRVVFEGKLDSPAPAAGEDLKLTWESTGEGKLVDGEFTAPGKIEAASVALVTVHTAQPSYAASAHVLLLPANANLASETPGWLLILMAALCGALGATLHGINSLAAYAGARQFLSSWTIYYLARPFVGGLMAALVFLVFRSNLVGDAQRLVTADWLSMAALAGLTGLFSDKAVRKLEQVVEVVFGPAADPRPHKLEAEEVVVPAITQIEPRNVAVGSGATTVQIAGTNFAARAKVKVNGAERECKFKSAMEIEAALTAEDTAAAGELRVQVVVGGKTSNEMTVTVT